MNAKGIVLGFLVYLIGLIGCTDCLSVNMRKQSSFEYELVIVSNRLVEFSTVNGEWNEIVGLDDLPNLSPEITSISPARHFLITWEQGRILENGVWLVALDELDVKAFDLSLPSERGFQFARVKWPIGDRFAILEAGDMVNSSGYKLPIEQVTNSWLIDTVRKTLIPWYWNCSEIVRLFEMNEFAIRCPYAEFAQSTEQRVMFLTVDGPQEGEEWAYESIYTHDPSFLGYWAFSPYMDRVVFGSDRDHISVYNLDGRVEDWNRMAYGFYWSPSGQYLAVFSSCSAHVVGRDACVEIIDVELRRIIWDDRSLTENLIFGDSLIWTESENSFFLLSYFRSWPVDDSGGDRHQIWYVSVGENKVVRWDIPGSFFEIVKLNYSS